MYCILYRLTSETFLIAYTLDTHCKSKKSEKLGQCGRKRLDIITQIHFLLGMCMYYVLCFESIQRESPSYADARSIDMRMYTLQEVLKDLRAPIFRLERIGRTIKGQLISKCPFGVKTSSKKPTIFSRISALASKKRSNQKTSVRESK